MEYIDNSTINTYSDRKYDHKYSLEGLAVQP